MVLSKTRKTKALIRLPRCAGWSAPVLFANPRRQVFSHRGPIIVCTNKACIFIMDLNRTISMKFYLMPRLDFKNGTLELVKSYVNQSSILMFLSRAFLMEMCCFGENMH